MTYRAPQLNRLNVYIARLAAAGTLAFAALAALAWHYEWRWSFWLGTAAYSSFLAVMASLSVGFILARTSLLAVLGVAHALLAPVLWVAYRIPLVGGIVEVCVMLYFFLCFRGMLLFDRIIRFGLRWLCQVSHPTGRTLSIVNSCDPDFAPLGDFGEPHSDGEMPQQQQQQHRRRSPSASPLTAKRAARSPLPSSYPPHYSEAAAISLGNLARLVYEDRRVIRHELERAGYDADSLRLVHYRNTCGFVAKRGRRIVVAFRGTDPLNLMSVYTDSKMGMVSLSALDMLDEEGKPSKEAELAAEVIGSARGGGSAMDAMGKIHFGFAQSMRLGKSSRRQAVERLESDRGAQQRNMARYGIEHVTTESGSGSPDSSEDADDDDDDNKYNNNDDAARIESAASRLRHRSAAEKSPSKRNAKSKRDFDHGFNNGKADDFTTITLSNQSVSKSFTTALLGFFAILRFTWTSLLLHTQDPIDTSFTGRSERKISAYEQASLAIDDLYEPGDTVLITGHSLGGALAIIFFAQALHEQKHWIPQAWLYTYGSPRVGDKRFARFLSSASPRVFHFVNNNDVVPRVPWKRQEIGRFVPAMFLRGEGTSGKYEVYSDNAGTLVFIDGASGRLTINPPKLRGITFTKLSGVLNSKILLRMRNENIVRIAFRLLAPFFLNDHIPCDYVRMLKLHRRISGRPSLT